MAERTITVGLNPPDRNGHQCLHLNDSEGHDVSDPNLMETWVNLGDTVRWVIKAGSGISSLEGIEKTGGTDLFAVAPHHDGQSYVGTIKSSGVPDGTTESYNIWYKRTGSDIVIKEDPKLKMIQR